MGKDIPDEAKFLNWFMKSRPTETYISRQILTRFSKLLYDVPLGTTKKYTIDFTVEEIEKHLRFTTTDLGFVFLGVMGKCIMDVVLEQLKQNISKNIKSKIEKNAKESVGSFLKEEHKMCNVCGYPNNVKMHYCGLCGNNLGK
jgi:hypothetical protein